MNEKEEKKNLAPNKVKKKKKALRDFIKNYQLVILALPGLIWFFIFSYLPLFGNLVAFKNFKIHKGGFLTSLFNSEWVWFDNFKFLFSSSDTLLMLRNTILYNVIFIILNTVLPIIVAIGLSELLNKKVSKFFQSMMFFPYFLSWVVISYFIFAFLDPSKGMISAMITNSGGEFVNFYVEPKYWPFILILANTWKALGYGTVLYLASIVGIDRTYYEAAVLDGASKMQQVKHITLPFLKPVMIVLIILGISKIMNSDFGLFYQVPRNQGALFSVTQTLDTYVYRAMTQLGNIGMSSAAVLFQSVIGFVLVMTSNFAIRKFDRDNSLF